MAMRCFIILLALGWNGALFAQMGTPVGNDLDPVPLTETELKEIFLGNKSIWDNNNPVTVVLTSSDSEGFAKVAGWALEAGAFEFQKHWLSIVFQGRANAPVFLNSEEEVLTYIRGHKGAIGLLYTLPVPPELSVETP